jgi:hypothetical protein
MSDATESQQGESRARAIGMSNGAASGRIEEDYAGSRPYQHSIEIIRNAAQKNGTTYVCSDIVAMPGTDALKRTFINNGPALSHTELDSYMTTIGDGDGDIWRLNNTLGHRHAGARTAVLPWTDVLILSWDHKAIPDGLEMRLLKNAATSEYEYTPIATPAPEMLKILSDRPEVHMAGHGVAFIYLGRDESVDGPFVDPNPIKGETDNGIVDSMRDRIYAPVDTAGQDIKIIINTPMPAAPEKGLGGRKVTGANGTQYRLDGREIRGHKEWTQRSRAVSGTVVLDPTLGVEVTWTLLPSDVDPTSRHLPFGGKGHIIARYKNESMVLAAPGSDYPDLPTKMRLFGVHLADVYNRLSLEITGPTDPGNDPSNPRLHLHQDPTRSKLVLSNGADLPLAEWGERFIDQMPPAIAAANKAARERISTRSAIKLTAADRLKARLKSRIATVVQSRRRKAGTGVLGPAGTPGTDYLDGMVNTTEALPLGPPSATGVDGVTPGGTKRGRESKKRGAKRRTRVTPNDTTGRQRKPGSERATEVQPRPAPVPEAVPLAEADWTRQGLDAADFASWEPAGGVVYFNLGHPIMRTQFAFFTGEWLDLNAKYRRRIQAEDVRNALVEAYAEDTIGRIMHYVAERTLANAKHDLTDRILTIGAYGFENVQAKVEEYIRACAARGVINYGTAA